MCKEVRRVEGFKAWELVPFSEFWKVQREYPGRASIGYIVAVLTCKSDPNGDPREPDVTNKFRISMSEGSKEIDVETHSSCADDISNRFVTSLAPVIEAHQTSIDVGGAYFHGTPPAMEDGGRAVFAVVPYWLQDFGPYPEKNPNGSRNLLRITGNMPGRCDAGRIWQARFDLFLRSYGLRQLITDPRIWVERTVRGTLIIHDHVDDSRLTSTTDAARSHFYRAWAAEFNSPPEPTELSENFTGLRHQRVGRFTVAISCMGVIRQLEDLIAAHPAINGSHHDIPLPVDALSRLREGPTAAHPLCPDRLEMAQRIAGTIGFITNMTRPDAHFAYCTLSRYLSEHKLTTRVFAYLVRVGRYITSTKELCLHLTAPPLANGGLDLFSIYADSSHGNAEDGATYGGFVLLCRGRPGPAGTRRGGGAIAWKCEVPAAGDDSSGAAELRMVVRSLKYTIAMRTNQRDLDIGIAPTQPTNLYTDASAVVSGRAAERMAKSSRWMAVRYAMVRWAEKCLTIRLGKIASEGNCGDMMTKCLAGLPFFRHRATLLGLDWPRDQPDAAPVADANADSL
jgi:hypothetical protein